MNTKVGVLVIGRKRPGFDQEWNLIMRRKAQAALEALGFTPIGHENPVIDDQTINVALGQIRAAGCDALLILQPSLGHGQLCAAVAQQWKEPIVLWATPERTTSNIVSSCSLVAQHLWASTLRQSKRSFEFVYGDPDDAQVRKELTQAIAMARTAAILKKSKLGLIGSHAPGFIDMNVDPYLMREKLGLQLHVLSLVQFIDRVKAVEDPAVKDDLSRVSKFAMNDVTPDDLVMQSRYYIAMRELMKEEQLDGFAIQCWPELSNSVGNWPYFALARLTEEGLPVAMEGDVDSSVTGLIAKHLGLGVGFITDWLEHDSNTITFWHPGIAPMQMLESSILSKHFNIQKPMVVDGLIKVNQPVTVVRFWQCDGGYFATAFDGKTIPMRRKLTGNTALVEVNENVREKFDDLIHEGMPHHVTVFFGHHASTVKKFSRMIGAKFV